MTLSSLNGAVTATEISSFETFMAGEAPPTTNTFDNTIADGTAGMESEALGMMYEVTNDPTLLNKMITYADQFLALRNDTNTGRIMWDGTRDPIWLTKPATNSEAGYAGCENNDIVGHIAYCARLILQTPSLWDTTVPDGNPFGYGTTYFDRAETYISQMEVTENNYMLKWFINPTNSQIIAPTNAAWTAIGESVNAYNRQMMFMNGFQRLSECHQLLGDNPAKVAQYNAIVQASMNWFISGLKPYTTNSFSVYDWYYAPGTTDTEDMTLHADYDMWGISRAFLNGTFTNIPQSLMAPFGTTLEQVIYLGGNKFAGYVNGNTNADTKDYIYPAWTLVANFDPSVYFTTANANISQGSQHGTAIFDAFILWTKNARYLGAFANNTNSADYNLNAPWLQTVTAGNNATSTVAVGSLDGFNSSVTLGASGLPAGVTASFSPASISGSGTSTMTLTASGSTAVGIYPIGTMAITGNGGSIARISPFTLNVLPQPNFTISVTPSSQNTTIGNNTNYTVSIGSLDGFSSTVALSVSGLPANASGSFSPASVTGGSGSSTLNITTATNTPNGNYTLTIIGVSGTLTNSTTVTLVLNDFTVTALPSSQGVPVGSSTNYTVTVGNVNGFGGTVNLSASGLPTGASASFNPASISALGTSTMTVTTASTTPASTSTLTITGTSGNLAHSTTVALNVEDFTISATPSSQTVTVGGNTTYTTTVGALNGFGGSVGLTVSGLPTGATASFSPTSITGSGSSVLGVSTSSSTPAGSYTLTITGTSGGLGHSTTVTLNVADFTISASPSSQTVMVGGNTTYTTTVGALSGFSGSVGLTVSGLPTGATASFSPTSVIGSGGSTLSVFTSSSTPAGSYTLTITGTSGGLVHSTTVTLNVTDFTISASPSSQAVTVGSNTTYTTTVGALNGFSGSVGLTISGLPTGATASFSPTSVTGSGNSTLSVSASSSTPAGSYTLTITGTSGGLVHSTTVTLNVTDFTISATPSSQTVMAGNSTNYNATIGALNGFSGNVALTVSGLPTGASASFSPTSVSGSGSATLTISTTNTMSASTNTLTITGTSGSLAHSTTVTLIVNPVPLTWTWVNDTDPGITYSTGWNYSTNRNYGDYNNDVHYTTGTSNYAQYTFTGTAVEYTTETYSDEGNVQVYIDGTYQTTVSCNTSNRQAQAVVYSNIGLVAGTHTIEIVKNSGNYMLLDAFAYVSAPVPSFALSTTPSSQTVAVKSGTSYTTTIAATNGFTGNVSLSVSGLPTGASASFSPATVTNSGSSTLSVSTSSSTPAGTYTLSITATGGSLVQSNTVTLNVTDFSISASPSSQALTAGASTTYTATTTALNGFGGNVALTISGLPAGATASFSPSSVTGSGSSTLTITTTNTMASSTNTLTITGTSGSLVHTTTVTLIVNAAVWTEVNDTASGITYSSGWSYSTNRNDGDFNNDVHYTKTAGSTAQYTFTGTSVQYVTETYSDEGNVQVYIDGVLQATVSCNSSTRQGQVVAYSNNSLAYGSHTIEIVMSTGTYMLLDAFSYR